MGLWRTTVFADVPPRLFRIFSVRAERANMPRLVRAAKLDTPSARARLAKRAEPYWATITLGHAIGYRRGKNGGTWIARLYRPGETPPVRYRSLAAADDAMAADGDAVLSFAQAQERARAWFASLADERHAKAAPKPLTVREAMTAYMDWYKTESDSASGIAATQRVVDLHILPALGDVPVKDLTTDRIEEWRRGLSAAPARLRSRKGATKPNYRAAPQDREHKRRRKATANRILTVLKAALNRAYNTGKVPSDDAWRKVKPHRKVDAARVRYLSKAECQRLVNAAAADLRAMIRAALLTGCRYGELAALRVADFNADAGTVTVRHSKAGKPRHVPLDDDGKAFFAAATAGRKGSETLFLRANGRPWGPVHQVRPMAETCKRAKIDPPANFHVLRHTYASHLAMNGVPMAVIAAILGHADTRMTEKHYAHLSPDHVALTLRANAPKLGIVEPTNVVPLATKAEAGLGWG
jgi:integrase